jgi:hypothetical protein
MAFIVSASAAISPFASTTNFWLRSPFATGDDLHDAADLAVRFDAIRFTLSVRSSRCR